MTKSSIRSPKGPTVVNGILMGYSDDVLANLLTVKAKLCASKFELKIDDVVFIGHPLLLHPVSQETAKRELVTMISFNVVIALLAPIDREILMCYHNLTKQLAIALRHEERRCGLLSEQKRTIWSIQDEIAARPEDSQESPYGPILEKCRLSQQLKHVYDELCSSGVVQLYINKWVHINWCLPHKLHNLYMKDTSHTDTPTHVARPVFRPQKFLIEALRPYHGMLLLIDATTLLDSLPIDASPSLVRLIKVTSPFKSLQTLASDADISLRQVYQLVGHLVYWRKATIIFPLCEANVYVLSPNINTFVNSSLVEKCEESFPNVSLPVILSEFSVPSSLGDHKDVLGLPQQQAQEVQVVTWLLQHGLLVQLHTYVLMTPKFCKSWRQTSHHSVGTDDITDRTRLLSSNSDLNSTASDDSYSLGGRSLEAICDNEDNGPWCPQPEQILAGIRAMRNNKIGALDNQEELTLLARLCPYFDGKHHLEEIMYAENIRRSQLLTILDKFRDILITSQHEDPVISAWLYGAGIKRSRTS
ncbi:hypothetical protein LSH36_873g00006 [Paralvinella palmiformis]|uniref:GATOR complex protein NPRL3 n=1 Tax=Paralvinella palmiformis TaxID=53620 RepID=A0AAD9IZC1_9ANNE|nr:hypothetical protein LSH36_873g00006 [Paralvinella palmiformis]